MSRKSDPAAYLQTYAPELTLMDKILDDGRPRFLTFRERAQATAARHRFYRARAADRGRATRQAPEARIASSPYDKIRVEMPIISGAGLWEVCIRRTEGIEDIEGLVALREGR